MGFWHTGYMEHHADAFFGAMAEARPRPPAPPQFPCPECGLIFDTVQGLEIHRFDGHPSRRPVLLLRGLECGRSRIAVAEPTTQADWTVLDCQTVTINGDSADPSRAGAVLSTYENEVVSVILAGPETEQVFDLRFCVADPADLDGVDGRLHEMVRGQRLTLAAIENFLAATSSHATAADYRDGIATYLYGVLARERSAESDLPHEAYRERFDESVARLSAFDRAPANVICGLVGFHYNHFAEAMVKTQGSKIAWASSRLSRLLRAEAPEAHAAASSERSSLEYVLSDAMTEQVLGWSCQPLDGSAAEEIADMEAALHGHEPFDQLKLRILAAEHHLRGGSPERGRQHANELRHNPIAERWAQTYLSRMSDRDR